MRFGKIKMFLLFNGLIAMILLFYFLPWAFSSKLEAKIISPYYTTMLHVQYEVNGVLYENEFMRNGIPSSERWVMIRYLPFDPAISKANSFMGLFAEPLAWWSVFLIASAMLLLTHNVVFSKGTIFQLQRSFPFISMEEYFPLQLPWWYRFVKKEQPSSPGEPTKTAPKMLK